MITPRLNTVLISVIILALANQIKGEVFQRLFSVNNITAKIPGFLGKNITTKNPSPPYYGYFLFTYNNKTNFLNVSSIFSQGSQLFSPYVIAQAININLSKPTGLGDNTFEYNSISHMVFSYYFKISNYHFIQNGAKPLFLMGDLGKFTKNVSNFSIGVEYGASKNQSAEYSVSFLANNKKQTIQDVTGYYEDSVGITFITLIFLSTAIASFVGLFRVKNVKQIPYHTMVMAALGNIPLVFVAFSRGSLVFGSINSGYWQLYLWLGLTVAVLGKVFSHTVEIVNQKRDIKLISLVGLFLVVLFGSFLLFPQFLPFMFILIPGTLILEATSRKIPFTPIALTNGLIISQLTPYVYTFYYPYNSALIPIRDTTTGIVLLVILIGVYIGCFVVYSKFLDKQKEDPEGDAHDNQDDDKDGYYAKDDDEEAGDSAGVEFEETPTIKNDLE